MSKWAKDSLINFYDIAEEKIIILPGGANIQNKYLKKYSQKNNNLIFLLKISH